MAIRVRRIGDGLEVVALCAAESEAEPGDLYLDDVVHHALTVKFTKDLAPLFATAVVPTPTE